jgi:hypothetical protein
MSKEPEKPTEEHLDPKAQSAHKDEVIVAPRGTRRARFLMTFLLVVMVLTTFTVSDQVMRVLGRGGKASAYVSWTAPDGTRRQLDDQEFLIEKRKLAPITGFVFATREREPNDDQMAMFLVLEDAAQRAGVRATDADVAKFIKDNFQAKDQYQSFLRMYGISGKEFEEVVRRALRFRRYQALVSQVATIADPAEVEKRWKGAHQEYAFDYVEVPITSLEAEARAQAPDDAGLKAWFDALPEGEKAPFRTKELVSAELSAFQLEGEFDASRLFAKYPRPADENAEQKAREFVDGFSYVLYRREKPEPGKDFRKTFDEAKDQALRDAPAYNSLSDWLKSMSERAAKGETVDLAAEAQELGLSYRNQIDPLAIEAWQGLTIPWAANYTLQRLFEPNQKEGLFPAVVVEAKGFVVGRVTKKLAPRMPEYDEVKAAVLDAWTRAKAKELALAKLEAVRDTLGTRPDPNDASAPPFKPEAEREKFLEAVRKAGFEPQRREWAEQNPPPAPEGDSDAAQFFRQAPALFTNKVATVPKPEVNRAATKVYLVRMDGVRDADIARITPADVQQISQQVTAQERMQFAQNTLYAREALQQHFNLDLRSWHPEEKGKP